VNKGFSLTRIISGRQTGADQGGLFAARDLGIRTGGTAPQGWLTENGPQEALLRSFDLVECTKSGYPARTRENVLDADGTLLVGQYRSGGSALTARIAHDAGRPLFHLAFVPNLAIAPHERIEEFLYWLERYDIHILNVAGNRESRSPGFQELTRPFLLAALGLTKVL
jgi:hypothetical protein